MKIAELPNLRNYRSGYNQQWAKPIFSRMVNRRIGAIKKIKVKNGLLIESPPFFATIIAEDWFVSNLKNVNNFELQNDLY